MKYFLSLILFISICVSCSGGKKITSNTLIASIGNYRLSVKEFSIQLSQNIKQVRALEKNNPELVSDLKKKILENFLYSSLIQTWAEKEKIHIHPTPLNERIKEIKDSYPTEKDFLNAIKLEYQTYNRWSEKIYFSLLEKKIIDIIRTETPDPSLKQLKEYYDSNKKEFLPRSKRYKIFSIVFENKKEAEELISSALNFTGNNMSLKFSEKYKHLGTENWINQNDKPHVDYVKKIKINEITPPYETKYGHYVSQLLETQKALPGNFKSVKSRIVEKIKTKNIKNNLIKKIKKDLDGIKYKVNQDLIDRIKIEHWS